MLLVRTLGPHLESVAARVSTTLAENMAASRIAVRAAGEALGEILGVVIIAWDVADHFQTKRRELPVLRTSIADYLAQVRHRLLHDPQSGIITLLDTMEMSIAESQQTRQSSPQ